MFFFGREYFSGGDLSFCHKIVKNLSWTYEKLIVKKNNTFAKHTYRKIDILLFLFLFKNTIDPAILFGPLPGRANTDGKDVFVLPVAAWDGKRQHQLNTQV